MSKPDKKTIEFYQNWFPEKSEEEALKSAYMYPSADKGFGIGLLGGGAAGATLAAFLKKHKLSGAALGALLGGATGHVTGGAIGLSEYDRSKEK